jgi:hypothetical protein
MQLRGPRASTIQPNAAPTILQEGGCAHGMRQRRRNRNAV